MRSLQRNSKNVMSANELSNRKRPILGLRIGFPQVYKSQLDTRTKKRMTTRKKKHRCTRKFLSKTKKKQKPWKECVLRTSNKKNNVIHFPLSVAHLPSATCKPKKRETDSSKFWNNSVLPETSRPNNSSRTSTSGKLLRAR